MSYEFMVIKIAEQGMYRVYAKNRKPHEIGPADTRWIARQLQKGITNGRGTSWDDDRRVLDWHAEVAE